MLGFSPMVLSTSQGFKSEKGVWIGPPNKAEASNSSGAREELGYELCHQQSGREGILCIPKNITSPGVLILDRRSEFLGCLSSLNLHCSHYLGRENSTVFQILQCSSSSLGLFNFLDLLWSSCLGNRFSGKRSRNSFQSRRVTQCPLDVLGELWARYSLGSARLAAGIASGTEVWMRLVEEGNK